MGHIDEDGYIKLVDRSKDLIKSGGEWISSVDLENALMGHPAVKEAAVIGVPHPKWQERPLAVVVLNEGAKAEAAELREFLAAKFAKWQLPDAFVFAKEIPRTSVGKFRKTAVCIPTSLSGMPSFLSTGLSPRRTTLSRSRVFVPRRLGNRRPAAFCLQWFCK